MIDFSTDKLVESLQNRPHVVILGAGATMATIPNGDKYGNKSSVMNNFLVELQLENLLSSVKLETQSSNLEDIYSEMDSRKDCELLKIVLENKIKNYFANLQLPDELTIYDYLLISLRRKDYVFTFNWDPLLIQAYQRMSQITNDLPLMVFLHGNVGMGRCNSCGKVQCANNRYCLECGCNTINPSKILFPVKDKNYTDDEYISEAWNTFLTVLSSCTLLTVFGYSAPNSDAKAVEAMKLAFASNFRRLDSIEIIDIKQPNDVYDLWSDFIHVTNDHYNVCNSFWESSLIEFPRRSVEGYVKRNIIGWWGYSNVNLKECSSISELQKLLQPLLKNERQNNFEII